MSQHPIAPGRVDQETILLVAEIVGMVMDALDSRLLGIVVNSRIPSTAITGQMGPSQGGTGNALGQATPLDGSVTNVKVATDAAIEPSKLDQPLLLALVYELVKSYLVAGENITIIYNDGIPTITISSTGGSEVPPPPDTYVYLVDDDGAYIVDDDGAYLWEPA